MNLEYFATGNKNKLKEANQILDQDLEQIDINLPEPQAVDVEKIVKIKAKRAYQETDEAVLVEDTSLEFSAWNGLPGALIKWFLKRVGNEGILKMLKQEDNRKAIAKSAVGFFDGEEPQVVIGKINGTISKEVRGEGFGWDPIFIPDGYDESFAEMDERKKNEISMRRKALEKLG